MTDLTDLERVIRELTDNDVKKSGALMRISLSAREIKRVVKEIKLGYLDLDQALIDIAQEADFIIRYATVKEDQAAAAVL